eukprot:TRINITY_DN1149_c3_g1_i1.p2 TRINITY_DN1149_c3_g1~~TRINITY_DN1149_c3_g1_i1.p2  ORF type:complete len:191 (-),score=-14.02 TRINITY_DN1149_c3_g1_i1:1650-2222(-)
MLLSENCQDVGQITKESINYFRFYGIFQYFVGSVFNMCIFISIFYCNFYVQIVQQYKGKQIRICILDGGLVFQVHMLLGQQLTTNHCISFLINIMCYFNHVEQEEEEEQSLHLWRQIVLVYLCHFHLGNSHNKFSVLINILCCKTQISYSQHSLYFFTIYCLITYYQQCPYLSLSIFLVFMLFYKIISFL